MLRGRGFVVMLGGISRRSRTPGQSSELSHRSNRRSRCSPHRRCRSRTRRRRRRSRPRLRNRPCRSRTRTRSPRRSRSMHMSRTRTRRRSHSTRTRRFAQRPARREGSAGCSGRARPPPPSRARPRWSQSTWSSDISIGSRAASGVARCRWHALDLIDEARRARGDADRRIRHGPEEAGRGCGGYGSRQVSRCPVRTRPASSARLHLLRAAQRRNGSRSRRIAASTGRPARRRRERPGSTVQAPPRGYSGHSRRVCSSRNPPHTAGSTPASRPRRGTCDPGSR